MASTSASASASPLRGKRVLIVATGGNVDAALFTSAIS